MVETKPSVEDTSSNSGLKWYDAEGFYYCMSSSRDWFDEKGEKHTYYTGYVLAPNTGFKIIVDDYSLEHEASEKIRRLANAGYYNIIEDTCDYNGCNISYTMLIPGEDDSGKCFELLIEHTVSQGVEWQQGSGGYINIYDTDGKHAYSYTIYAVK